MICIFHATIICNTDKPFRQGPIARFQQFTVLGAIVEVKCVVIVECQ